MANQREEDFFSNFPQTAPESSQNPQNGIHLPDGQGGQTVPASAMFPTPPSSGLSLYLILCYYWLYSAQRSSSVEAGRVTSFLLPYLVERQNTNSSGNGSSLNPRIDEYLIRSTV
jgi:hypothetical protein